jgi:hypothetical protein
MPEEIVKIGACCNVYAGNTELEGYKFGIAPGGFGFKQVHKTRYFESK